LVNGYNPVIYRDGARDAAFDTQGIVAVPAGYRKGYVVYLFDLNARADCDILQRFGHIVLSTVRERAAVFA
jgi:hypothetical protein